jgi:hypothetical protein
MTYTSLEDLLQARTFRFYGIDASNQQPRRIRLAAPRKDRKLIPFSLDITAPVKIEESSPTFTSNRTHISMLTDDFSPSESSSPVRIDGQ